jgi:hypothetical protein
MVESATGSTIIEFATSPHGIVILMGVALALGFLYAYKQSDGYDPEEPTDVEAHRREAIERFGSDDGRVLIRNDHVVANLRNFEKVSDTDVNKIKKWFVGDGSSDPDDFELYGSYRMVGTRPRTLDKLLAKVPVLGRMFRDVYSVSQKSVQTVGPQSIVLDDDCPLEKVADIWVDLSPDSMSDVLHVHGLAMFEANQSQNEEYVKAANWRNPVGQELQKIAEEFGQRSKMYNDRENDEVS